MSKVQKSTSKFGFLPEKLAEADPWEKLCTDLIGPYDIKIRGKKHQLWCVTMIDPATSWFEMKEIKEKTAITIANVVEQVWLTRYPWPTEIVYDRGTEFMAEFTSMVEQDYGITPRPITTRNPQANAILERLHRTIGNMIRTFDFNNETIYDKENSFSGIL